MRIFTDIKDHWENCKHVLLWTALALPVALLAGSASAFFLWALDLVTHTHWKSPWLLFLLPVAGFICGWVYHRYGGRSESGNNLIIDEIHQPGGGVPYRMAPLVLFCTLVTHLFGGSAGREGTAVQMGGSIASFVGNTFRVARENHFVLLMCGVSAGFGSVFGTPLTGAIFAMEVLIVGRLQSLALIPVLIAAAVGDWTCSAWGIHHTIYHIDLPADLTAHLIDPLMLAKVAAAGILFGLVARLFSEMMHASTTLFRKLIKYPPLRPVVGGVIVIGLFFIAGTDDYLGLGVYSPDGEPVSIVTAFEEDGANADSWLWKTAFTAITLGSGFKGGEVTPLFFVGSTFGNTLSGFFDIPVDLLAGLGFIAVFAGATNTPLACTIMGIELFGSEYALYYAAACFMSYLFSGRTGIYRSQLIAGTKRELNGKSPLNKLG